MELVQELFITVFVAFIFSFIVAKLVSIAMAGHDTGRDSGLKSSKNVDDETVIEKVNFDGGLRVEGTKSKKKVRFVEEVVEKVDEFEGEGSVDELEVLRCGGEFVERCCDLGEVSDAAGDRYKVEESSEEASGVVGLPEKSSEGGFGVEEVVVDIVGVLESEGVKGESVESGLEGLVVEERGENAKADEFDGVKEERMAEEKIGNEEVDGEIGVKSTSDDDVVDQSEKVRVVEGGEKEVFGTEVGGGLNKVGEEKGGLASDEDDDWEGIERSEMEKVFAAAADYVNREVKDDVGSDVQMMLYGLHKVAMEGPCHEPQPMALMVSARAKWNAWQRLGKMSPEVAMEQYISLLSDKVPGWMQGDSAGDGKTDSSEAGIPGGPDPNIRTFLDSEPNSDEERKLELKLSTDGGGPSGGSNSVNKDKE